MTSYAQRSAPGRGEENEGFLAAHSEGSSQPNSRLGVRPVLPVPDEAKQPDRAQRRGLRAPHSVERRDCRQVDETVEAECVLSGPVCDPEPQCVLRGEEAENSQLKACDRLSPPL